MVRVYVSKKVDTCDIKPQELIPLKVCVGNGLEYEVDIVEIGEIKALDIATDTKPKKSRKPKITPKVIGEPPVPLSLNTKDRYRPLLIGCSAMGVWDGCTACTLGGFAKNKVPGEEEFIGILANNHCYPGHVEVLTIDGFKRWDAVSKDDKFATLTEDHVIEYHKPINYFKLNWDGNGLYRVHGANFSFTTTPGQNIYAANAWFGSAKHGKFTLTPIENLVNRLNEGNTTTMRMFRSGQWIGKDNETFTDSIIEFIGWYITEGSACINSIGQNIVSIRQREGSKYEEIYKCLKSISSKTWKCKSAIVSNSPELHSLLNNLGLYGVHAKTKFIPSDIKNLPSYKLRLLLDTMLKGDGSIGRVTEYHTASKKLADDISEICLKLGIPTTITIDNRPTNFANERTLYSVLFLKRSNPLVRGIEYIPSYNGNVYDVEVPNHTLLIREEGTAIWSGNCAACENKAAKGTPYIQPSRYDNGRDIEDKIGELWRFVEIKFSEFTCPYRNAVHKIWRTVKSFGIFDDDRNHVDIAFVKLDTNIPYSVEVLGVGKMNGKADAVIGDRVEKVGRTTGLTTGGVVADLDWNGAVSYSRGNATFHDCILVKGDAFSAGGDSSSFVYKIPDKLYIGNLFAGSDTYTIICKGSNVEKELQVEVLF